MIIYVGEDGEIRVKQAYNGIYFEAEKETITVCERDGGFEIAIKGTVEHENKVFTVSKGKIRHTSDRAFL